jgi:hypothetical protein
MSVLRISQFTERPVNTQLVVTKSAARHSGKALDTVCKTLAKPLTRDEARQIAANIAKLPGLLFMKSMTRFPSPWSVEERATKRRRLSVRPSRVREWPLVLPSLFEVLHPRALPHCLDCLRREPNGAAHHAAGVDIFLIGKVA